MQEHNAEFRSLNRRSLEVLSLVPLEGSIPQVSHGARQKTGSEYTDDRWGIGEAQSTSVQLLNKRRQIVDDFEKNKLATIRISYSCPSPIKDAIFGIRITHLHGTVMWGSNTKRRGIVIPTLTGAGYIDLEIESLPLLEGTYDLTVALSDMSEIHEYDHWERRIRFNVFQYGIYDEGLVSPASQWGQIQQN